MRDYKEPVSRVQKRTQFKRLIGIMGGMIFVFLIFIVGIKVGIQLERERVRIAQQITSRGTVSEEKGTTQGSGKEKTAPPTAEKDKKMQFTFYETLTRKEGGEKEHGKEEKTTPPKEKEKVTINKEEAKVPSRPTAKVEETHKTSGEKKRYFVQIASFKEKEAAEGLKDRLLKKGYTVLVIPAEIEGMGLWYRVRLGGYTTLKEAQSAQKKISVEEGFTKATVVSGQ